MITIHMVTSLDGFIAKKDNSVAWFETADHYEKGSELSKEDMERFLQTIDCYVMGSNTYEHALQLSTSYGWPYGDVPTIVITGRDLPALHSNVELFNGELEKLVAEKLVPAYKNVWVAGGAMLAREFIRLQLADEIRLSIIPIILGDGIKLFEQPGIEQALHLIDTAAYKNGIVELRYEIRRPVVH